MRFPRILSQLLRTSAEHFPAVVLTGGRQTGKTTLLRQLFADYRYVSLDLPSTAELAEHDPERFLATYPPPVLIDEVQYAPQLFRHLKVAIEAARHACGQFILTGSQKFTLMREVADSLAGRCAWHELEALCAEELRQGNVPVRGAAEVNQALLRGFFPELWRDSNLDAATFYGSYLATYIERDVRQLINITNLRDFERFIRLCATYSGQLINKSDLGRAVGVSAKTITQWLSVLEASNQITLLEPYFGNVGKRMVKTPKLYFNDTGLLCFLLGIDVASLQTTPFRGALWETLVYAELRKLRSTLAPRDAIYFYRDQEGREVDFLLLSGAGARLLECKWTELPTQRDARAMLEVAKLLETLRPVGMRVLSTDIVARPHEPFPLQNNVRTLHGFDIFPHFSSTT